MVEGEPGGGAEEAVDPINAVVGSEAAKSTLGKLLGPTAEAVGQDLAHLYTAWSKPRRANIEAILAKGGRRTGTQRGYVNSRVLHAVFEDGSWVSDEVGQEYFAGLLLSSGSDGADSDDGVYYAGMVAGLTSNQIRLHHAIYHCFASNVTDYLETTEARMASSVWMSVDDAAALISVIDGDDPIEVVSESFEALNQRGLISLVGVGTPELFASAGTVTAIPACATVTTDMGIRLFLRAYGVRTSDPKRLFDFDWSSADPLGNVALSAFVGPYDKGFAAPVVAGAQPGSMEPRVEV